MSYIRYGMKSIKMIERSRGIIRSRYLRRLNKGMRCKEILGQGSRNIKEGVLDDFLYALVLTEVID